MTALCTRLRSYLDEEKAPYEVIHHRLDYTAQEAAADSHTPGREFAKTVVVRMDGRWIMVVLSAHHRVNLEKLRVGLGGTECRLASEKEMASIFTDCEVGAETPFGNLYDLPVYVSPAISEARHITFNAGTHEDVIRMRIEDFDRLVRPIVIDFSDRP